MHNSYLFEKANPSPPYITTIVVLSLPNCHIVCTIDQLSVLINYTEIPADQYGNLVESIRRLAGRVDKLEHAIQLAPLISQQKALTLKHQGLLQSIIGLKYY